MANWTFLTNHGQVFLCIASRPQSTAREIAATVGITERAAQKIIDDLEADGYLTRYREGRRNRYEIHSELPMRHPAQKGLPVGELLQILAGRPVPAHGEEDEATAVQS